MPEETPDPETAKDQPRPLEAFSTDDLLTELRFRHSLLFFLGVSRAVQSPDQPNWHMQWTAGTEYTIVALLEHEAINALLTYRRNQ